MTFQLRPCSARNTQRIKVPYLWQLHIKTVAASLYNAHVKRSVVCYQRKIRGFIQKRLNQILPHFGKTRLIYNVFITYMMNVACPFRYKIHNSGFYKMTDAVCFYSVFKSYKPYGTGTARKFVCCFKVNGNVIKFVHNFCTYGYITCRT